MSYLAKVKYLTLNGNVVEDVYGYVEYLVKPDLNSMSIGKTYREPIALYDIDGNRIDDGTGKLDGTYYDTLPYTAYIWNVNDFKDAINAYRDYI